MKQFVILFVFLVLAACNDSEVKKPDHLIERDDMVNLLYDLSVLEVVKYQNPPSLMHYKKNIMDYVYKKYNIDSVQLVQNNKYYAADYKDYKSIFEEIKSRVDLKVKNLDSIIKIKDRKKQADSLKQLAVKKTQLLMAKKPKEKLKKDSLK